MQTRSHDKEVFLKRSGWQGARLTLLAGDASFRKYDRVWLEGKSAVLMDAPPDKENILPFISIGEHLVTQGFSAPQIYARDIEHGFLLLEDLGDDLFARVLKRDSRSEEELYRAASDVLADLYHRRSESHPDMPVDDMTRFLPQVALWGEWFLPLWLPPDEARLRTREYLDIWKSLLQTLPDLGRVMVLYDYHAENLLWLEGRKGAKKVGLLDFQDAVWGSPAYDMVSLLEDARRDVSAETTMRTLAYYLECTGIAPDDFMAAYALLGAQRNCRIVGTFVRLARRDGKHHYLAYLPRVWRHLEGDLAHPLLAPLKTWMDKMVPQAWRNVTEIPASGAYVSACAT